MKLVKVRIFHNATYPKNEDKIVLTVEANFVCVHFWEKWHYEIYLLKCSDLYSQIMYQQNRLTVLLNLKFLRLNIIDNVQIDDTVKKIAKTADFY
jgi:hypothetical protein